MKRKAIFLFLLFLSSISLAFAQGLYFKGNESLISSRTSYNVFENINPTFKEVLTIEFSILPETNTRGNILRLINKHSQSVYSVTYFNLGGTREIKLNHEGKESLITYRFDDDYEFGRQWIDIKVIFDFLNDSVLLSVNNVVGSSRLSQNMGECQPIIQFGRSEHIIDVPPFKLYNLKISDRKKSFFFPLTESEGEHVHDSKSNIVGKVTNPTWLINEAYYWNTGPTFSSKKVAGSNFNPETQEIYYFNEDSITIYNLRTRETTIHTYKNPFPMEMRLGTNFLDQKNNSLFIYEVADPPSGDLVIAKLDLSTFTWEAISNQILPMQLHHHSNYFDGNKNSYYVFGGFGNTSYYKNFYRFDLDSLKWIKVDMRGEGITPRYFSSMGGVFNSPDNVYVFGGMGNEIGDQTIGRIYYYDLYKINLEKRSVEKLWNIDWTEENVVPVRNLLSTDSDSFYTLCYPEHFSKTFLKLYRFSIKDGKYEILGDSIPILSEKINTNANLYFDKFSSQLISIVQEFDNDDIASTMKVYSLAFPPVAKDKISSFSSSENSLLKWHWILIIVLILLVILLSFTIFSQRRNKHKLIAEKIREHELMLLSKNNQELQKENDIVNPNSIYLFGDLTLIDKNGKSIGYMLSTKLRQAFLIILSKSHEYGISSNELSEILWPEKSFDVAKNSRGVTLNNLRKILGELDGVSLLHERGKYLIQSNDNCYCDYLRCLEIAKNNKEEDIEEFTAIVSRGKFLQNEEESMLDPFKQFIESSVESTTYYYLEKVFHTKQFNTAVLLSESIFRFDPLDEIALDYLIKALVSLDRRNEAKQRYYQYLIEYRKVFDKDYEKSFEELERL